jgi:DNA primase
MVKTNQAAVKQNIDLRELAGRYTTLHRESVREMAGPCPKCGGDDRFHVTETSFMCRQCHAQWGDAIEFVRWVDGVGFKEALNKLGGSTVHGTLPARSTGFMEPEETDTSRPPLPAWAEKATHLVNSAHERLFSSAGQPGADYLLNRGLEPHTWHRFHLGYREDAPLPGTWNSNTKQFAYPCQPAIVTPWHNEVGQVKAVRYRFLQSHGYNDANGQPRRQKQCAAYGSHFAGQFYGWPGLLGGAERLMTLLICEGELNALSCWQAQHDAHLDVLSLGSESQRLTPDMIAWAQQYRRVIVWADKNNIAWELKQQLPGAYAVRSPNGQDANDLLRTGKLGAHLAGVRFKAATTDNEREGLLWDLCDAVWLSSGVDIGTVESIEYIANLLGKKVSHDRLRASTTTAWLDIKQRVQTSVEPS